MIECFNCRAQNLPGATICRMCNSALDNLDDLPATIVMTDKEQKQASQVSTNKGQVCCPTCKTMNEPDYAYCQQCGTKLRGSVRLGSSQEQRSADGLTIVAHSPIARPGAGEQAGASRPKPGAGPEPAQLTQAADDRKTVAAEPMTQQEAAATVDHAAAGPEPQRFEARGHKESEGTSAEGPEKKNAPLSDEPSRPTHPVAALSQAVPCPKCARPNRAGSAFCTFCGEPITFERTVVMTSLKPARGKLRLIVDGVEQEEAYELHGETAIGRTEGDITFPHDGFMSGRHARLVGRGDSFAVVDDDSSNGVFIKIKGEMLLQPGDVILIGRQIFRFEK